MSNIMIVVQPKEMHDFNDVHKRCVSISAALYLLMYVVTGCLDRQTHCSVFIDHHRQITEFCSETGLFL